MQNWLVSLLTRDFNMTNKQRSADKRKWAWIQTRDSKASTSTSLRLSSTVSSAPDKHRVHREFSPPTSPGTPRKEPFQSLATDGELGIGGFQEPRFDAFRGELGVGRRLVTGRFVVSFVWLQAGRRSTGWWFLRRSGTVKEGVP